MAGSVCQWATIFFFTEFVDKSQLQVFEQFRAAFQEQWCVMLSQNVLLAA